MSVTDSTTGNLTIRLDRLFVPENVREIDEEFIARLERSVKARGRIISPVEVIAADPALYGDAYDHVLVAGFRRTEVARRLGHETIPGCYGDAEHEHTDRAVENIVRKDLNPYEEAIAIKRILDEGKSEDQAAELLGMTKHLVTRRAKLLELPDAAQRLVGDGTLTLATVDPMRTIAQASPALLDAAIEYITEHAGELEPDYLTHRPLMLVAEAAATREEDIFAVPLDEVPLRDQPSLVPQDEATVALIAEAKELSKQLNPYSYFPPTIRFTEAEIDRARAGGVLLEFGEEAPLVTDFAVYQDLCRTALASGVQALKQQIAEREEARRETKDDTSPKKAEPDDERATLEKQHRREMRALAATAHSANLDLGNSLKNGLTVVDPADMNVARFFVFGLLGPDGQSSWVNDSVVSAIALRGIRFVIADFREDQTKTRQDGSAGVLRMSYGDGMRHENQSDWLWKYLDGARNAEELYGRALVVIAAEQYASRLVVPGSQQGRPLTWPSHEDIALKALAKLAGAHLAPTLKALEKGVAKAEREYQQALTTLSEDKRRAEAGPTIEAAADQALSFIQGQPGITIPELAARMGIQQNHLYRVLPGLEHEGKVSKQGRGWHSTNANTTGENGAPATLPGLAGDAQDQPLDADESESGGGAEQLATPVDASTIQPPNEGPAPMPDLEEDLPEEVVPDAADVLDAAAEIDF
jgi:ParB/RepB/Spo0J family partition protein